MKTIVMLSAANKVELEEVINEFFYTSQNFNISLKNKKMKMLKTLLKKYLTNTISYDII